MSDDALEGRLAEAFAQAPGAPDDRRAEARAAALDALPQPRRPTRRVLRALVPLTGLLALGSLLVFAMPRGTDGPSGALERPRNNASFVWAPHGGDVGLSFIPGSLDDLRGSVVMLVFADEIDQLGDLDRYTSDRDVQVLAVARGGMEGAAGLQRVGHRYGLVGDDGDLAGALGVESRPTTVLLGKDGRIAASVSAAPSWGGPGPGDVRATLAALRAEATPAGRSPLVRPAWILLYPGAPTPLWALGATGVRLAETGSRSYGPTTRGVRVVVGTAASGGHLRDTVVVVRRGIGRVSAATPMINDANDQTRFNALPALMVDADGRWRTYLVRSGFATALVGGRRFRVRNGAVTVLAPQGTRLTLVGPAGRRTINLDAGLG
ncbi:MAG: TlpA family protein disulfide reductase [Thermoleophilia bacterium]|nr:TlpA family protein disulfide reductase [Thermoleophilia bacterium]